MPEDANKFRELQVKRMPLTPKEWLLSRLYIIGVIGFAKAQSCLINPQITLLNI